MGLRLRGVLSPDVDSLLLRRRKHLFRSFLYRLKELFHENTCFTAHFLWIAPRREVIWHHRFTQGLSTEKIFHRYFAFEIFGPRGTLLKYGISGI